MSWQNLQNENPTLAQIGRRRLHSRVSYLAAVQANGAPAFIPSRPSLAKGGCLCSWNKLRL